MQFRTLGKTGWEVSTVGMGCWALGGQWGPISESDGIATVRKGFDCGINLFDTADAYGLGLSEEILGKALQGIRDQAYVATKAGNFARRINAPLSFTTPYHVFLCCDASLHRLRTDRIDLFQCHIGQPTDYQVEVFLEAFDTLKQKGKIRWGAVSTNSVDVVKAFDDDGQCAACQLDYSILNHTPERDVLPYCAARNIGTLIRGPLAKGVLSGKFSREHRFTDSVRSGWNEGEPHKTFLRNLDRVEQLRWLANDTHSLAQASLQFCLADPWVTCLIPGAKSPEQAEANAKAADGSLSDADLNRIREIADAW